MNPIPDKLAAFLQENKISTVCFIDYENNPYCINCFYSFDEESLILVFKSAVGTTHQKLTKPMACISGTILPNVIDTLKLKGIQFTGKIIENEEIDKLQLNLKYVKKYPMSLAVMGYVWAVRLDFLKFTDNTLGFGNKTIWTSK
ncbi:MAG: hypothetical protein IPP64_17785 [Bacteroidetes bacterium]|nr:hypothetical protein [Bacteroidota bacterium]